MKFNIWTLVFQLINFFVLLYILKRFLYKPIREIMEKRRGIIKKNMDEADKTKEEAQELKDKQQEEMNKIKEQQAQASEQMHGEIEEERKRLFSDAEKEANAIIERKKSLFEMEKKRFEGELKDKAIDAASSYAAKLLKDIANEELHKEIYKKFLHNIEKIASDITSEERKDKTITIYLISAFPVSDEELKDLQDKAESFLSKKVTISVTVDKSLIVGVKMKVYDTVYDSSLQKQIENLTARLKETV